MYVDCPVPPSVSLSAVVSLSSLMCAVVLAASDWKEVSAVNVEDAVEIRPFESISLVVVDTSAVPVGVHANSMELHDVPPAIRSPSALNSAHSPSAPAVPVISVESLPLFSAAAISVMVSTELAERLTDPVNVAVPAK